MIEDTLVASIDKNRRERLRVALRTFRDRRMVDLRVWAPAGDGSVIATPKGVAIKPELLRSVIEALQAAEEAARAEGLLPGEGGAP